MQIDLHISCISVAQSEVKEDLLCFFSFVQRFIYILVHVRGHESRNIK